MKNKPVEIGTIWGPVKPYDPNDPVQKALDELKEISEIKLVYVDCNVLSVTPLPERIHPLLNGFVLAPINPISGYAEKITYIPVEMKVSSAESIEVINFKLHPSYRTSLVQQLPLQTGDDIRVLLPHVSGKFGSEAMELEKKVGEIYDKIYGYLDNRCNPDEPLLRGIQVRAETLLKRLD